MFGLVSRKRALKVADCAFNIGWRIGLIAGFAFALFASGFIYGNRD